MTVVVLMVVGFIASLNVAVTTVLGHTPTAAAGGETGNHRVGGSRGRSTGCGGGCESPEQNRWPGIARSSWAPVVMVAVWALAECGVGRGREGKNLVGLVTGDVSSNRCYTRSGSTWTVPR